LASTSSPARTFTAVTRARKGAVTTVSASADGSTRAGASVVVAPACAVMGSQLGAAAAGGAGLAGVAVHALNATIIKTVDLIAVAP
jgi:hypothetical protein